MTFGADVTSKLSSPPAHDLAWVAIAQNTKSRATVVARTFFAARSQAMALLGCGPDEVVLTVRPDWHLDTKIGNLTLEPGPQCVLLHPADLLTLEPMRFIDRLKWWAVREAERKPRERMPLRRRKNGGG
jgi:hypothetical protein